VPNVKIIRGLNLSGTPRATSACCGMTFIRKECAHVPIVSVRVISRKIDGQYFNKINEIFKKNIVETPHSRTK